MNILDLISGAHTIPAIVWVLCGAWLFAYISVPIVKWIWGDAYIGIIFTISGVVQMLLVAAILWSIFGWKITIGIALVVMGVSWGIEIIGVRWGIPFGHYRYTPILQPQGGGVPLLIPVAWLMMMIPALGIAASIFFLFFNREIMYIYDYFIAAALAGGAMAAWDLYLDPLMVSWGCWRWEKHGRYLGIPVINFFGWWITATIIGMIILVIAQGFPVISILIMIYCVMWILQGIAQIIFWHMPLSGLAGFIGMGIFGIGGIWGSLILHGSR